MNPYAKQVGDRDPVEVIAHTPEWLAGFVHRTDAALLERHPIAGKWNAREILVHLADAEIAFAFRLRQTLAEEHHVIQPWDQDRWSQRYSAYTTGAALELFRALRLWNLALIRNVPEAEYSKPLTHPERGKLTFRTLVETMAGHDLNHLAQLQQIGETGAA